MKITRLGEQGEAKGSAKSLLGFDGTILNYGQDVISPGLIDTHVHMDEPGREHWEGGPSVSMVSGCMLVASMSLTLPPAPQTILRAGSMPAVQQTRVSGVEGNSKFSSQGSWLGAND